MIKNQVKGEYKQSSTLLLTASWANHTSAARSDLCYRLQHEVIKFRRQNQES